MKRFNRYHGSNISFIDMLFNINIVFVLLFFIAILLMNEPTKKKDIEAKADVLAIMTWPDGSPHDFDLWIKLPDNSPIGYLRKESTFVFLDRDDLGIHNNYIEKNGEKQILLPRREVVAFRGKPPGRYVVNSVFFMAKGVNGDKYPKYDGEPVKVLIELIQINPVYKILQRKEIIFTQIKEERTAFAFIITDDGMVTDIISDIEEPFVQGLNVVEGQ